MLLEVYEFIHGKATPEVADIISRCCVLLNSYNASIDDDLINSLYSFNDLSTDDLYWDILDKCVKSSVDVLKAHGIYFEPHPDRLDYFNEVLASLLEVQNVGELAQDLINILENSEESDIEFRYFEMLNHLNPKLDPNPFNHGLERFENLVLDNTLEVLRSKVSETTVEELDEVDQDALFKMQKDLKRFVDFIKGRDADGEEYIPDVPIIKYFLEGARLALPFTTYAKVVATTWDGLSKPIAAAQLWVMVHMSYEYGIEKKIFQTEVINSGLFSPEQLMYLLKDLAIIESKFEEFKKPADKGGLV